MPGADIPQHDDCLDNPVEDAGNCSLDTEGFSSTQDPSGGYSVSWTISAPNPYFQGNCNYPCTGMFEYSDMGTTFYATVNSHT